MFLVVPRAALLLALACIASLTSADRASTARAIAESKYTKAHSLDPSYSFHARDGWETVNATNLSYKYRRDGEGISLGKVAKKKPGSAVDNIVDFVKGLVGIGTPQTATITWYTGKDLENPSCWANGKWAPTDASFACALTMTGWKGRPKCFEFLELCHTSKKCVFVRVVDSCAGCAPGSRHVDLTKAAFAQLADFDTGILTVHMRLATEPTGWSEHLWGPQVKKRKGN